ncbi:MAG TPA: thermonuclease family protein [Bosea sp. (in: a-proteobacteria)]|jgi:endonuclease YncB( thermonuclease family)|uniref:thermonuclease family protein n=1 Tax=Bosea sp. (in: a-proteobacteria) TaxID=1871050 RepID=UPI002E1571BB|nr:thermonuclease family protein [Bosea sp. (in: a-proteobacteria)]
MGIRRDLAGMTTSQWGLLCGCVFVIAMGAGLGVLTPKPQRQAEIVSAFRSPLQASSPSPPEVVVIRAGRSSAPTPTTSVTTPFPICGRGASDCVIDGDTFQYRGDKIRIADIDAPETGGAKCASERALGDRAKHRLAELLSAGDFTLAGYGSRDRDQYGRALRVVYQDGRSLGAVLVSEGLARPWEGRRRPWCIT